MGRILNENETFELFWTHELWHSAGKLENPVGKAPFFLYCQQLAPEKKSEIHQRAALEQYLFLFSGTWGPQSTTLTYPQLKRLSVASSLQTLSRMNFVN